MRLRVRNFFLALVSLFAAVVLWLHVVTEKEYSQEFILPLRVVDLPQRYVVGNRVPRFVRVKLRGRGKDLFAQLVAGGQAVISARKFSYGRKTVRLSAENLRLVSSQLEVEEIISPKSVVIDIDRRTKRSVRVVSRLVVEPARGFVLKSPLRLEPQTVSVEGPEKRVSKVREVYTVAETLRGFNTSTSVVVGLLPPGEMVRVIPDAVTAFIDVEPIVDRRIDGVAVNLTGAPRRAGKLAPQRISVVISGAKSDVENIKPSDIKALVSYSKLKVAGKAKPDVICPKNVQVVSTIPEYIKLVPSGGR